MGFYLGRGNRKVNIPYRVYLTIAYTAIQEVLEACMYIQLSVA
jgi:phage gpG-like protein